MLILACPEFLLGILTLIDEEVYLINAKGRSWFSDCLNLKIRLDEHQFL
jgi:hypothetical protein